MTDILNDGVLGEPTRGFDVVPPSSSHPSPSRGLQKAAAAIPTPNEQPDELDEILSGYWQKTAKTLKQELEAYIAQHTKEAVLKARIEELEAFKRMTYPNQSPFGNQYLFDYANDRIWNLNALQSKSETGKE